MTADLSILNLVLNASLVVKLVMALLLVVSLISWTMIITKWLSLQAAQRAAEGFEKRFWSGGDLGVLYKEIAARGQGVVGLETLFEAGFKEFAHLRKQVGASSTAVMDGAQRAMRAVLNREINNLETHLSFLATVGSTSPYIGLFGTVWGIMNAFLSLGQAQQATLATVAPGIAESLIATAMGLFAAIPAVIAYNRYNSDVERLINRYEIFLEEFSTLLQRHTPQMSEAAR